MSKFKNAALALAIAGLFSAQAHASEAQAPSLQAAPVAAVFSASDIQGMFEQAGKPMEVAALSSAEMKETEGAVAPILLHTGLYTAGGALVGGVGHVWRTGGTTGIWRSVGAGATGGFYASPLARGVFGANNFARFTVGSFGTGSWFRH